MALGGTTNIATNAEKALLPSENNVLKNLCAIEPIDAIKPAERTAPEANSRATVTACRGTVVESWFLRGCDAILGKIQRLEMFQAESRSKT